MGEENKWLAMAWRGKPEISRSCERCCFGRPVPCRQKTRIAAAFRRGEIKHVYFGNYRQLFTRIPQPNLFENKGTRAVKLTGDAGVNAFHTHWIHSLLQQFCPFEQSARVLYAQPSDVVRVLTASAIYILGSACHSLTGFLREANPS